MDDEIERKINAGEGPEALRPLDDTPPTKTVAELSVEHPDWAGLAQAASYLYKDNPDAFTAAREGRRPKPLSRQKG